MKRGRKLSAAAVAADVPAVAVVVMAGAAAAVVGVVAAVVDAAAAVVDAVVVAVIVETAGTAGNQAFRLKKRRLSPSRCR
jgi:hypothetical protein